MSDQMIKAGSYPQSVVPGTRAEGSSIWGNTQCTNTVLMSKQDGDPCSFENIPYVYGVVIVATEQKPAWKTTHTMNFHKLMFDCPESFWEYEYKAYH